MSPAGDSWAKYHAAFASQQRGKGRLAGLGRVGLSPETTWRRDQDAKVQHCFCFSRLEIHGYVHWISNQERFGAYASLVAEIALEANTASYLEELPQTVDTDRFDSNLLTRMDNVLNGSAEDGKTVIFLHTMGSHLNYSYFPRGDCNSLLHLDVAAISGGQCVVGGDFKGKLTRTRAASEPF